MLLLGVLSVLHHQDLVRRNALEKENRMGEVWKWDIYFGHLLEVRLVRTYHHSCPDPCCFQVKRLQ